VTLRGVFVMLGSLRMSFPGLSLTVSPIKNESGEIIGASKIARDTSEANGRRSG